MGEQNDSAGRWDSKRTELSLEAAHIALWSWNVDDNRFAMDERGFDLWQLPASEGVTFEDLSSRIHPADRDRVRAAFLATRSVSGFYETDFRIILDEKVKWISSRGMGADVGMHERSMFGVFLDVTARKQAEEASELLAGEMSHRVKNLLTIASGLTQLTSRSAESVADMARELTERLMALDRAHDLVRPLPNKEGKAVLLGDLLAILLAPYDDTGAFSGRIRVAVPRMGIGEKSAITLAMVFHELATNSVKHGCLSADAGMLDVSTRSDDENLVLVWAESGGPQLKGPPSRRGFGTDYVARTLSRQLRGAVTYDWHASGMIATLKMRSDALTS
ncbi:MAG TPA: HWE histidine kinase domain-containing protein [Sphingomicrobium sp.]|nr:HWE histidine kinase domain-containing protein [Sphingomicrobium sp.]